MGEEKIVFFPVDEEKAPVEEVKKVCSPMLQKIYIPFPVNGGGAELVVSPRSRDDMTAFEIWGCISCVYDGRVLPEVLWCVFSCIPPNCLSVAFDYFIALPLHLDILLCNLGLFFYLLFQFAITLYPLMNHYWYPYRTSFRSMGPKGKFMIDFIPALTAAALHHHLYNDEEGLWHFLELNYAYLFLLLGCTGYLYVVAHFMRRAYDVSGKDVMLGLAMQSFCFMVNGVLIVRAIALSLCFGISCYRYMTYSAPPAPPPRPKMDSLPY